MWYYTMILPYNKVFKTLVETFAATNFTTKSIHKWTKCRLQSVGWLVSWLTFACAHHRLNGSSSPVLTATSLSYGESKNSTPHRIKTPDPIEIKFGTVDYVGRGPVMQNFMQIPSRGASRQKGEIYAKIFIYIYVFFFLWFTHRSDLLRDFYA